MSNDKDCEPDSKAPRDRLSRLVEASLRINESLDFEAVLRGVLDSARGLTGARYGVITLLDDKGQVQDFLASGMTSEEAQQLWELPDGSAFFDYLRQLDEPLRLRDFHSHTRSLGLPHFSPPVDIGDSTPFLAAPVRNRGEAVGIFFLAVRDEGQEFTAEDEETIALFAAQAALVIVNARRYRQEQRARSYLETLIDTSPVGVVVFDARTGAPTSINREVTRLQKSLRMQDSDPEQVLEVLTLTRADGREASFDDLSTTQAFSIGETIRAEEVVLGTPNGHSLTVLLNATPIRLESGEIESFVVTLQDMTPIQEMERLRAEFLGMVSHELRTPLSAVKGSVTTLLDPAARLNRSDMREFLRIIDTQTDKMRGLISDLLDVARIETGALSIAPEPTDLAVLVDEARTAFVGAGGRHAVLVDLPSDLPWGMADRPRIGQVLDNLIANAARQSPESSPIEIGAELNDLQVAVWVSDRGRGIPAERLPRLFRKFSRLDADDQAGDTGLGLAICKGIVEAHGGRIWAESDGPGLGARFTFTVPTVEGAGFVSPVERRSRPLRHRERTLVRVLAVDDDPQALRHVRDALSSAGYLASGARDAEEALRLIAQERPELVLLDLMLPGTDGIEVMAEIKEAYDVPVIFLSAYGQDELVARAFDKGAADYVVKPFSPTELAARIRAALRRQAAPESAPPYVLDDLTIDYAERRVTLAGRPVRLTAIEFRTLAELALNAGRVLSHQQLLRRVWGEENGGDVRPMRTVISTLRRRLEDDSNNPKYIFTEPRVGYRMAKGTTEKPRHAT